MRPLLLGVLVALPLAGCGAKPAATAAKSPVLLVQLVQENGLHLKLRYAASESKVPLQDGKKFAFRNDHLYVTGTVTVTEQRILDLQLEVDTRNSLKVDFAGFPASAILRAGKRLASTETLVKGKHQYRITYALGLRPGDVEP